MNTVGVVVTSYNHSEFIADALDSILRQSVPFSQVVVVDDGSESHCVRYVAELCGKYGIKFISSANKGVASARNLGFSYLNTEYVVFLDDDDLLSDVFVDRIVQFLETADVDCICFQSTSVIDKLVCTHHRPSYGEPLQQYCCDLPTYCPATSPGACAYRAKAILRLGLFDTDVWGADDFDLLIRTCATGKVNIYADVLLYHRLHSYNASSKIQSMSDNIGKVICKNYRGVAFDKLIRLSYWYGGYGPLVYIKSIVHLYKTRENRALLVSFTLAYIAGRTVRRLT